MSLHDLDRPNGSYSDQELEKFAVFCLLDRAQSYASVCRGFDTLNTKGLTTKKALKSTSAPRIAKVLKSVGYRFPNQTAKFLHEFGSNPIDLRTATRNELFESIKGMGMKLASMYVRNTRGEKVAVIDIHIKRWLQERGITSKRYLEQEAAFLALSKEMGRDPIELDLEIWQERRV